jgi:hypothetical protein
MSRVLSLIRHGRSDFDSGQMSATARETVVPDADAVGVDVVFDEG